MFDFVSEARKDAPEKLPYFEDVRTSEGWQGQATNKSIDVLKAEISTAITLLHGIVSGFERGKFGNRDGYRIHYVMEVKGGKGIPGYIDIAALPNRPRERNYRRGDTVAEERRQDLSLRMALYNVAEALKALNVMAKLSPGFIPLMPWMIIEKGGKNLTQTYAEHTNLKALMPPSENFDEDVVEGEIYEKEKP